MAGVIDADTHVIESAGMWDLMDEALQPRRPVVITTPTNTSYGTTNAMWLIDGNIFPRPGGKGGFFVATPSAQERQQARTDISIPSREMTDLRPRIKDMDDLNIATQIVYPTLFLVFNTKDAVLEKALCHAYNQWMANVCAESGGRIRYVAILPLHDMNAALEEVHFAKVSGAVGIFLRGIEDEYSLADPFFFPLYEEISKVKLPICIHTGAGCPAFTNVVNVTISSTLPQVRMLPLMAFRDIVANRIPEKFPDLRWGFIEAASSWVPYILHALKRLLVERAHEYTPDLFKEYNLFVACEADEDISYLLNYIDEDHLYIGSDYGHTDPSAEAQMVATLRGREDVSQEVVTKILIDNSKVFYDL